MQKQKLTLLQKISYAHWWARSIFEYPTMGWLTVMMATCFLLIIMIDFFLPEIKSLMLYLGIDTMAEIYVAFLVGLCASVAVGYAVVYVILFVQSLVTKNKDNIKRFLEQH